MSACNQDSSFPSCRFSFILFHAAEEEEDDDDNPKASVPSIDYDYSENKEISLDGRKEGREIKSFDTTNEERGPEGLSVRPFSLDHAELFTLHRCPTRKKRHGTSCVLEAKIMILEQIDQMRATIPGHARFIFHRP